MAEPNWMSECKGMQTPGTEEGVWGVNPRCPAQKMKAALFTQSQVQRAAWRGRRKIRMKLNIQG